MITVGGCGAGARRWPLPPSSSISSSWTTFTTCWAGVSDLSTSCPTAFSRTRSMKTRTTLKLTSASSRATRISRSASWMLSSLSRPRPPSRSKIDCSFVLRESSMERWSLRNYAEDYNSGRRGAASAARADALANRLPPQQEEHEAERQEQRGQREPELERAPAGSPVPSPEAERSQQTHVSGKAGASPGDRRISDLAA